LLVVVYNYTNDARIHECKIVYKSLHILSTPSTGYFRNILSLSHTEKY